MRRQHATPYLVHKDKNKSKTFSLYPMDINKKLNEKWLQNFIFDNPNTIPINEIEPAFGPLIPICCELGTNAGPIDILFVNENGLLTIVECKLWKNPDARRTVVGQILDYAKELSQWSYSDLQKSLNGPQKEGADLLIKKVSENVESLDEIDFIDNVSKNLKRGRFLLLIVGDGIRENVMQITNFLQEYGHLNFCFALVEMSIHSLPEILGEGYFFVQPRVIAQTVEITRAVVRIEDGTVTAKSPIVENNIINPDNNRKTNITEQIFMEQIENVLPGIQIKLISFIELVKNLGLIIDYGKANLMIKSPDTKLRFGSFTPKGVLDFHFVVSSLEEYIGPDVGIKYINTIASLFEDGIVDDSYKDKCNWNIRKNNQPISVSEVLSKQKDLLSVFAETYKRYSVTA